VDTSNGLSQIADRICLCVHTTQVPPPATNRPTDQEFFVVEGRDRKVNHEFLKNHFIREGRLTEVHALYILEQATNVLSREANMVAVKSPVTSKSCAPVFLSLKAQLLSSMWRYPWPICEISVTIPRVPHLITRVFF